MDQDDLMIFQMMLTMDCNSHEFFTSCEMKEWDNSWTWPMVFKTYWLQYEPH
jgi:hypothetical protein